MPVATAESTPQTRAGRPLAVMTGTSRDVGEFAAYGLAQAGFDIIGGFRNPSHLDDQLAIASRIRKEYKVKMDFVLGDVIDPATRDQFADKVVEMGGRIDLLVLSSAGGYKRRLAEKTPEEIAGSFEESRQINVYAQIGLLDRMKQFMKPGSAVVYLTSDPAHRAHNLVSEGQNPIDVLGDYAGVAIPKNEGEATIRKLVPELGEQGINAYFLVGNALEGSFVTRNLKRSNPETVAQWQGVTERGHFPVVLNMAADLVDLARGNYPSGYTKYTGVASQYHLYRGHELIQ